MRTGGRTIKILYLGWRMIYRWQTGWSMDESVVLRKARRLELKGEELLKMRKKCLQGSLMMEGKHLSSWLGPRIFRPEWLAEDSVFVVRMDGEFTEAWGEEEVRVGMEKEFFLPLGWMASSGRCSCRSELRKQLFESLGRLCITELRWDLFLIIFCSGMCIWRYCWFWCYKFDSI